MKIFDKLMSFTNHFKLHQNLKNQKIFLTRKEIFNCFSKKKHLENLNGYFCRVSIGKFRGVQNIYCIGIIQRFSIHSNLQDIKENFFHKKIFVTLGKITRSFKVNFLSNSIPEEDEILDFTKKNLTFFSNFSSNFIDNRKKKILKFWKHRRSDEIKEVFLRTFFFSGPIWDFSI